MQRFEVRIALRMRAREVRKMILILIPMMVPMRVTWHASPRKRFEVFVSICHNANATIWGKGEENGIYPMTILVYQDIDQYFFILLSYFFSNSFVLYHFQTTL